MCMFLNSLPSQSKSAESTRKKNLALFIKPTKDKEFYKFRLLAFKSPLKNDRDYPFIERYIHQHWTKDENGKSIIDGQVVCPVTKFVKVEGNPYDACPICRFANMNFIAWKESNWQDRESAKKNREFGRKFEAIIPVYVTQDPVYPLNKGKFKVLIFTDKEFYKKFKLEIQKASRSACVFNGGKAVDFYIHMTQVPKTVNEGLPTQYIYNERVIDKFGFTKVEKAYEIPAINKENIDNFEFDDNYYVSSTPEELQEFYDKFIRLGSNDDIPDEDVEVYEAPKASAPKAAKTNKVVATKVENIEVEDDEDINVDDIDDLTSDPDDIPAPTIEEKKAESEDISEDELNDLVNGLDDI